MSELIEKVREVIHHASEGPGPHAVRKIPMDLGRTEYIDFIARAAIEAVFDWMAEPSAAVAVIERILRDEFELAKPEGLPFLEPQVPHIARAMLAQLRKEALE